MSEPKPEAEELCPQCGSPANWNASSWCPTCGYYPAVGRLVETPQPECEQEIYENWWQAVPRWMWILAGGTIAIFIISVVVRLVFAKSAVRLWWTLGQIAVGVIAFAIAHFLAYLHGASRTDKIGPLDAFLKPFATWQPVLFSLPQTTRMLSTAVWGLSAIVFAYFVIDGIDMQAIAEARQQQAAEAPKKRVNTMGIAVHTARAMAMAKGSKPSAGVQSESLEDALAAFTGTAGVEALEGMQPSEVGDVQDGQIGNHPGGFGGLKNSGAGMLADPEKLLADGLVSTESEEETPAGEVHPDGPSDRTPKALPNSKGQQSDKTDEPPLESEAFPPGTDRRTESIECVVIGYTTNAQGQPRSLLLASPIRQQLRFVAKVSTEQVDAEVLAGMIDRFLSLRQPKPVIASPYGGRWLKPELFCQVQFAGWSIGGRLNDPYVARFVALSSPDDSPTSDVRLDSASTNP